MKKLLLAMVVLLFAAPAYGGPFLVCDPQEGVTSYLVTGPAWVPTEMVPAQPDGSLKMDLSSAPVGQSSLYVQACDVDEVWGVQCSISSPFVFTRPGLPSTPANLGLSK